MAASKPSLASRLAQVLSDHDIAFITQEVDRNALDEEVNAEWLSRFARAIEDAVLARLAKQQPVAAAWMQHGAVVEVLATPPNEESELFTNKDAHWTSKGFTQTPLYTTPQPIRQEQALRVALEEMEYANQQALQSLGVEIISPKTIAALRAELQ
jgi:urocanate hydratase